MLLFMLFAFFYGQIKIAERMRDLWSNHMIRYLSLPLALVCLASTSTCAADLDALFNEDTAPFSLTYGDETHSGSVPAAWTTSHSTTDLPEDRQQQTTQWTDPATGLEVRLEATRYADFDAIEWVLHLTNNGTTDTPILENIRVADYLWKDAGAAPVTLHHAEGSHAIITDFQPKSMPLEIGTPAVFTPFGGRSSDGVLPFFNLAGPEGGLMVAIGWTGQWTASFNRTDTGVHIQAGFEQAHFKLLPGESVRTPSILLMPWTGTDRMIGQNKLRRLLLEHIVPQYDGAPAAPLLAASPHAIIPFEGTTEANCVEAIRNIATNKLPVDYFWIDAGWFVSPQKNWARGVGNFVPDPERFPKGLKPVADAAHEAGLKFLLWFEPERVMTDTFLFNEHPDWLIQPPNDFPGELMYQFNDKFHLLNLGKPEAAEWVTKTVSDAITEVGVDAYRNDFNMYPSFYWRANEAPDRLGINEIKYVTALYRYFDTLREQHPQLLLDTCASGGRRIDLEMLKRALILTRSDYLWDPTGQQCHTYGLAQWIPITGIGAASTGLYECRSGYGSHFTFAVDYFSKDPAVWDSARKALEECKAIAPLSRKDFYPLTPYTTANDAWMAWQYHDPENQRGAVQAFRRQDAKESALTCTLQGLTPGAAYDVTNADTGEVTRSTADSNGNAEVTIALSTAPAAAILTYMEPLKTT
jgi:alpha-galactosidase